MNAEQTRLFVDYVIGMPDQAAAEQHIQFSAFRFDDTFFKEVEQMIREAQRDLSSAAIQRRIALSSLLSSASRARKNARSQFSLPQEGTLPETLLTQDDYTKAKKLLELDKLVTSMMQRAWEELPNEEIIADWKHILAGYRNLLKIPPPKIPYYTEESLHVKIAQTLEAIAKACASMRNTDEANSYYKQAAQEFEMVGRRE